MITIHIEPAETNSSDREINEQARENKNSLIQIVIVIVLLLCAIVFSLLTSCSVPDPAIYHYQVPAALNDGWATASLTEVGLDSERITAMIEDIQDGGYDNLYSLLIVKDGKLVFEEYFGGHNLAHIDDIASVTKSITSILIGIAIDQGYIDGPDQYLDDLLPSYTNEINADPLKRNLQLWHILSMTSGIEWDEETYPYGDMRNDATRMERQSDPVKFILGRPLVREPGTQFQYSGANSMLLSAILQETTGMPVSDYAKLHLFDPLGIYQYRWDSYPDGHTNTDGGLSLRPRDMAKIGQLMLNNGWWDGEQIISSKWVTQSTDAHTTVTLGIRYGYQWWQENQPVLLESVEPYFAAGYGGQLITVYPDQNMILVVTGETANHDENSSRFIYLRNKYILPTAIPAILSKAVLSGWYLLTLGSLAFIVFEITKGRLQGFGRSAAWLLIVALFGSLGLVTYYSLYHKQTTKGSSVWNALASAQLFATGNITAIILLTIIVVLFLSEGSIILMVIPAAFLTNWLVFITPITASLEGIGYWKSVRSTILSGFISSFLVLVGVFPVLILLSYRWPNIEHNFLLFWLTMTACGLAGTILVLPYSLWMGRRKFNLWSVT